MYRYIGIIILIFAISGCGRFRNTIEPLGVIRTEANKSESEKLLYRAWEPAYRMTIDGVTVPRTKVKDFEEFKKSYNFTFVDDFVVEDVYYRSMASYNEDHEMIVDEDGYILFEVNEYSMYIPTIYDDRVGVVEAYYEEKIYDEEYNYLNERVLYVREESIDEEDELKGFYRINQFEENDEGRWVLTHFSGVGGQTPSKS